MKVFLEHYCFPKLYIIISINTFVDKVNSLNDFINKCGESCMKAKDIPEIISSLVFLDSLASIIYDFNDKTGGFLFEAVVSALIGGEQVETIDRTVNLDAGTYEVGVRANTGGTGYTVNGTALNTVIANEATALAIALG